MQMFLAGLIVFALFSMLPLALILMYLHDNQNKVKHTDDHPGITVGNKDILCPKCRSPYCQYYFEERQLTPDRYKTKTKVHLLNPFKPLVEEKTRITPGITYQKKRFRCNSCGWIFD